MLGNINLQIRDFFMQCVTVYTEQCRCLELDFRP